MSQLLRDIESLCGPVLVGDGVEMVDLTYQKEPGGWTLRFYLDKTGGFSLNDCADWSDRLGTLLDASGLLDKAYVLEVSSPGLDRPLKKLSDFEKFAGEKVHVKLFSPIEGQKNFHGVLKGADANTLRICTEEKGEVSLPMAQVARTKLNPQIKI